MGMQDEENEQKREGKTAAKLSLREKIKNVGVWENGHAFWVFSCPKSQKRFSPNSKSMPILFPPPCNN